MHYFIFFVKLQLMYDDDSFKYFVSSDGSLERLLKLSLRKSFLKILQNIIFIYFEMPPELYFNDATKFHSLISKPNLAIANLEAISLFPPCCTD